MTLFGKVALPAEGLTVSGTFKRVGPKAEDSLENTFSCVPKVQGGNPESLRQKDREFTISLGDFCEAVLVIGLLIFYRKKDSLYVRKTS